MHIVLVRFALVAPADTVNNEPAPALGLAYIASTLKLEGFDVTGIDAVGEAMGRIELIEGKELQFNGLSAEQVIERIPNNADIIGVSAMFSHEWTYIRDSIKKIKAVFPSVSIIVGGEHVTALPEYSLRDCPEIDYCVLGEGEETVVGLCRKLKNQENPSDVNGIAYLSNGAFHKTTSRKRKKNIAEIPWPDWDSFNIRPYLDDSISHGAGFGRNMPIMATRGCPYQCTFCSNPFMWTTHYYMRPVDDVISEIRLYKSRFNIDAVQFEDLTAIVKKKWILEFAQKIKQQNFNLSWSLPSGTRSEALDAEVLNALAGSGLKYLVYAPESGSKRTLDIIQKKINPKKMTASIKSALLEGIPLRCNFIIGFPKETRLDIFRTIKLAIYYSIIGVEESPLFPFQPYPGTALFNYLIERGTIVVDDEYFDSLASLSTGNLKPPKNSYSESVGRYELYFYRIFTLVTTYAFSYLFHPRRILRTYKSLNTNKSTTVLEHRLKTVFKVDA